MSSRRAARARACSPSTIPSCSPTSRTWRAKAAAFAAKCHELVSFLADTLGVTKVEARYEGVATYHDSCSGLRELGVREQPRKLLASVEGLRLVELEGQRYLLRLRRHVRGQIWRAFRRHRHQEERQYRRHRRRHAARRRSRLPVNMAGKLQREGRAMHVRHVAEVLAGMTDAPPIGESAAEAKPDRDRHDAALQGQRPRGAARRAAATRAAPRPQFRRRAAPPPSTRLPEFEALRDSARDIKDHTLAHLDLYLEAYERKVDGGRRPRALRARRGRGARDLPRSLQGARRQGASPRASR